MALTNAIDWMSRARRQPFNQRHGLTMADTCTHLDTVTDVTPSSSGCEDCERIGGNWVHLRLCMACGTSAAATAPRTGTPPPTGTSIPTIR